MAERVEDCIFCDVVAGDIPGQVIDSDERTITVLDVNPATRGHSVVIPRNHAADLFEVPNEDLDAVMQAARRVAELMKRKLDPAGFNILNNVGRAAWQTIFHFHVHVIPRYENDPLQLPWSPRAADPGELDELASELRA